MQLEPRDILEKLEFDKVLLLSQNECVGDLGKAEIMQLLPETDINVIQRKLKEVSELKLGNQAADALPLNRYEDLSGDLKMLSKEGFVLSIEALQRINKTLRGFGAIYRYFDASRQEKYPTLFDILRVYESDPELTKAIDRVIDEEGNIRPNASPALAKIRKQVSNKRRELDKQFRHVIAEYKTKGWLSDNVESIRNNRRVLSVPAEHKRKIKGIIHDESATGQTSFIEPEPIIHINNDIFDLEMAERQEIFKLLRDLSSMLHPYTERLASYQELLVEMDIIQAKARLASKMGGIAPRLRNKIFFGIWEGLHPLLLLKNKEEDKPTVPFDLTLLYDNRMLLVSGPNAGGKSIFMKAVGLLQIMLQSGFLIPVREDSQMGIFKKFFADIGDQQSIEDDLSTYSSRLKNMKAFLEGADAESLILIDEFGSGTDPKSGGAIAEAILKSLNEKKVFGILTTHYSNLKIFAFKNKGIVNGAMYFDKETLSPTYELKIGRPGSSYAYEIAQKTGLPKDVINYARHKTGKNERAVDQLLIDLQREKKEVEDKIEKLDKQRKDLERLMKSYEQLSRDLEFRRKKVKLEAKEQALQEIAKENKTLQKTIREIRESQNLEKAKELAEKAKREKAELEKEVVKLQDHVYEPIQKAAVREIKVGDYVKMRTGSSSGIVEAINKNRVILKMGEMHLTVKLRDLVPAGEPLEVKKDHSPKANLESDASNFERDIDIRGLYAAEAAKTVEDFVDRALLSNCHMLRIVHGKGNGALRKIVNQKLREYKDIQVIRHPEDDDGGNGVTIAEFGA